ncbi:hypothetical protein BMS3Abin03_01833 [bacterium BMS3Abin03]|nr:hypothetical protein BMS3Abin03_01833 [bacterium BMS3Abin03]
MDKDKLKKLAADPKFIPGIYNYCNRWCERCEFIEKCLNYAIGKEDERFSSVNMNNESFTGQMIETLKASQELLKEIADEEGVDLTNVNAEEIAHEEKKKRKEDEKHTCAKAAMQYTKAVKEWFDTSEHTFKEKEDELNNEYQLEIPNTNPFEESEVIFDAVEVIRWYQHQIYVKIMRALHGREFEDIEELDEFPKDSDGSAKVALIAIDNSIDAWEKLRTNLTDEEDKILDIIIHLDKLRKDLEAEFPDARNFVRPGFDEYV